MNKNASEATKTLQIQRLINGLQNQFDPEDVNDKNIAKLHYAEQEKMLELIIKNMSSEQRIELLMQICNPSQRPQVINCIRPVDVSEFWPQLKKERRMEIFAAFTDIERMKFMVCSDLLTPDLKIRLWDNIGKESRLKMWKSTMNVLVTKHC